MAVNATLHRLAILFLLHRSRLRRRRLSRDLALSLRVRVSYRKFRQKSLYPRGRQQHGPECIRRCEHLEQGPFDEVACQLAGRARLAREVEAPVPLAEVVLCDIDFGPRLCIGV